MDLKIIQLEYIILFFNHVGRLQGCFRTLDTSVQSCWENLSVLSFSPLRSEEHSAVMN